MKPGKAVRDAVWDAVDLVSVGLSVAVRDVAWSAVDYKVCTSTWESVRLAVRDSIYFELLLGAHHEAR